ncbi:30S ribosomal protein S17 [Candidatus Woesearchaeota archaeon]|nr:30S ribosomal protein S17 [Candidatus Woesearchaeota archaeon]
MEPTEKQKTAAGEDKAVQEGKRKSKGKNLCEDKNCPFHGSLKLRGRTFTGIISSAKMRKTASFAMERREKIRKYQRYEKRHTSIKAHNPDCVSAKEGDKVTVSECRPLSKTKKFVITAKH